MQEQDPSLIPGLNSLTIRSQGRMDCGQSPCEPHRSADGWQTPSCRCVWARWRCPAEPQQCTSGCTSALRLAWSLAQGHGRGVAVLSAPPPPTPNPLLDWPARGWGGAN